MYKSSIKSFTLPHHLSESCACFICLQNMSDLKLRSPRIAVKALAMLAAMSSGPVWAPVCTKSVLVSPSTEGRSFNQHDQRWAPDGKCESKRLPHVQHAQEWVRDGCWESSCLPSGPLQPYQAMVQEITHGFCARSVPYTVWSDIQT